MPSSYRIRRILQWTALPVATIGFACTLGLMGHSARSAGHNPSLPRAQVAVPAARVACPAVAPARPGRRRPAKLESRLPLAGMVVGTDPETGALGPPNPEQWRELEAGASDAPAAQEPVEIRGSDGSYGIDLRGSHQDYAIARMGRDGRLRLACVHADSSAVSIPFDSTSSPAGPEEQ